jgi:signal peptidase I
MTPPPVNPYAAMPVAHADPERVRPAPRWLALIVSVLVFPLAAAGLLVLRRSWRDLVWVAASLGLLAVYGLGLAPRLAGVALAAHLALGLAGIVMTTIARPAAFMGWGKTLGVAAALFVFAHVLLRFFVVQSFGTPSASMSPTLVIGDKFFVNKLARHPARGEVIAFKYPLQEEISYVKRVIGLPGETVAVANNQLLVNGHPLASRRLDEPCPQSEGPPCELWEEQAGGHHYRILHLVGHISDFGPATVPADTYFVLGDNRENSNDSRVWGTVPARLVQGRVTTIYLSHDAQGEIRLGRMGRVVE